MGTATRYTRDKAEATQPGVSKSNAVLLSSVPKNRYYKKASPALPTFEPTRTRYTPRIPLCAEQTGSKHRATTTAPRSLYPPSSSIMSHLNSWEDDPSAQQDENLSRQAQQQLNMNPAQAQQGAFNPGMNSFQPGAQSFTPGAQSFQPGQQYGGNFAPQYQQQQYYQQQGGYGYPQYGGQQNYGQYQQYGGGFSQGYQQQQGYGGYNQYQQPQQPQQPG